MEEDTEEKLLCYSVKLECYIPCNHSTLSDGTEAVMAHTTGTVHVRLHKTNKEAVGLKSCKLTAA